MSHNVNLKLSRFERQPWGFRLHGGTDFGTPLLIQKVNLSSLSEAAGLQAGDLLLAVNGQDVQNCKHKDAQDTIVRAGNNFELTVQRGGVLNQALRPSSQTPVPQKPITTAPVTGDWSGVLDANRAGAADNAEDFTKQFMSQLTGQTPGNLPPQIIANPKVNGQVPPPQTSTIQNHTRISTPIKQMTTSPALSTPQNPQMLHQYNSPQSLYSEDSIQEALSQQAEMLTSGVKGINFNEDKEPDLSNSETLKLVHELDNKGPEPEPGENGISRVNGNHDNGNITLSNVHNVHAPKMSAKDLNGGGGVRLCPSPSPSSTMPREKRIEKKITIRRTESPAPIQRPGSSQSLPRRGSSQAASSPAFNRSTNFNNQGGSQMLGQAQTQGRISVSSTEDIDYSSNKPKKVGNSFQWPPPKTQEDQGPTASPIYINPNSRTSSPAPRSVGSPAMNSQATSSPVPHSIGSPAMNSQATSSPVPRSVGSPAMNSQAQRNLSSPAMNSHVSASPTPRNISSPAMSSHTTNGSQFTSPTPGMASPSRSTIVSPSPVAMSPVPILKNQTQIPVHLTNTPNRNQHVQFTSQQNGQKDWSQTLNQNTAGAADNASDFTKNFLNQLGTPIPVTVNQNGVQNNLHNPTPMVASPAFATNEPTPPTQELPAAGPGQNVSAPRRGRGVLQQQKPGMRVPMCGNCDNQIRGPFITALGKTWCPSHFVCSMDSCKQSLQDVGFVEEKSQLYCEDCYGRYLAPDCEKCRRKIIGNCLKAMGKNFHPECFACAYCGKIFANSPFYLEDGLPYCEEDWNELFTTKCISCGFPIEAGDRWVEALNNNYHSQCFNCTLCKKNLEGQSFFVKAGKPFCKSHARG
eukprot:GFUD01004593.1.p1 GENE.GFUD01004593.1~~GFUD01004593.1.p1  ORF type:complete len:858 (-),score=130.03 GFUD01004593.1:824-3397(-)